MRIAISGSHGTGKSTLIEAFLARGPAYAHEPEAFESLADEIELTPSEGPTPDGLRALLEHTVGALGRYKAGELVVFERSPVDYLAYAAASVRSWPRGAIPRFLEESLPRVRDALPNLDLIVFLPVATEGIGPRHGEDPRFRKRVDEALRRALLDDDYDLFGESSSPRVTELSPLPERWLAELIQLSDGEQGTEVS